MDTAPAAEASIGLAEIMHGARNETEALIGIREWVMDVLRSRPLALDFYETEHPTREQFDSLAWRDYAAIRLLDYVENADREFVDLNLRGELAVSNAQQVTKIRQVLEKRFSTLWMLRSNLIGIQKFPIV